MELQTRAKWKAGKGHRAQGTIVSPWQVNRSTSGWQSSSPKQKGAQKAERAIMVGILMVIHQRNETGNGMDGGHESSERSIRTNRTSKLPGRARCWQSCRHRTRAVTHGPMCRSPPDSAHAGDFVVSARLRPFISGGRCGLWVCVCVSGLTGGQLTMNCRWRHWDSITIYVVRLRKSLSSERRSQPARQGRLHG